MPSAAIPAVTSRIVCVVEEPGDQIAIEKTGAFSGTYHILHGVIAPMEGIGPSELKMEELRKRVQSGQVEEILIATSSTVAGEATASYIAEMLVHTRDSVSVVSPAVSPWAWTLNMPMNILLPAPYNPVKQSLKPSTSPYRRQRHQGD